jgi:protein-S-isoprenylcysteine O-methyltransferase Ste14
MPLGMKRGGKEQAASTPPAGGPEAGRSPGPASSQDQPRTMLPARSRRSAAEAGFMRVIATAGIVGICVAIAAIMGSSDAEGWIIGLVVSLISVILAGVLWSSRRL